jgi:hypothetical protein
LLEDRAGGRETSEPPATTAPEPSWRDEPAFGSGFEIDRGFDPEWSRPPASAPSETEPERDAVPLHAEPEVRFDAPAQMASAMNDEPIAPFPLPTSDTEDESDDVLTEVASGDDLFNDPTRRSRGWPLSPGIIVPVMLGRAFRRAPPRSASGSNRSRISGCGRATGLCWLLNDRRIRFIVVVLVAPWGSVRRWQ